MIKKTSKITILASLLVASTINAQEFYTCVPKKSWWKDIMTESLKEGNKKIWTKIIDLQITSPLDKFKGWLQPGKYRVIGAGAGGIEEMKEFTITQTSKFLACVGAGGGGGGANGGGGGGGGGRGYAGYYGGGGGGSYWEAGGYGGCGYDGGKHISSNSGNSNFCGAYGGYGGGGGGGNGGGGGSGGYGGGSGGNGGNSYEAGADGQNNCQFNCVTTYCGKAGKGKKEDSSIGGRGGSYSDGGTHKGGNGGNYNNEGTKGGEGGYGCGGGGGGSGGTSASGGGGGGSYFKVADFELVLKGGDGKTAVGVSGGDGAGPDGYVIVERLE